MEFYFSTLPPSFLPKGVTDYLPERAFKLEYIERKLLDIFRRWGFQRVFTPFIEYLGPATKGMGSNIENNVYKFVERSTGRLIAFRPDFTPQIARIVATRLKDMPKPLRICYAGSVLRDLEGEGREEKEIFQAGVELIGIDLPEADAEMIAIAIEGMNTLGLKGIKIDVGQVQFLRGFLNDDLLKPQERRIIREYIHRKDISGLHSILKELRIPEKRKKALLQLPMITGCDEIPDEVYNFVDNELSEKALENLRQVLHILNLYGLKEYISIDLGEVRGFDYHTGVIFEGFVENMPWSICSGGRYDNLIEEYGYRCPATGFAFDMGRILLAMESQSIDIKFEGARILIINMKKDKKDALFIARALREKGFSVARDIIRRPWEESVEYARINGIPFVLLLGLKGYRDDDAVVMEVRSGKKEVFSIDSIIHRNRDFLKILRS